MSLKEKNNDDYDKIKNEFSIGIKTGEHAPCPFAIRYTRRDCFDQESNYVLDGFNPIHNHELRVEFASEIEN